MHDPLRLLAALTAAGPSAAPELCARLGISQPSFSRLVREAGGGLLRVGRARSTRYAARREVLAVEAPIRVYDVSEGTRALCDLHPVAPSGFYVEPLCEDVDPGFHADLPWFLHDLRPAGFLGRLAPRRHPELGLPEDVLRWSGDQVLRYLTVAGSNLVGALVVGEQAWVRWAEQARAPADLVRSEHRAEAYGRLASDVLAHGPAGSSAGGEQPKFAVSRVAGEEAVPVLVKFSPPVASPEAERVADLLVAEHLTHRVLAEHGQSSGRSELVFGSDRVFLEVERFDRVGPARRRGLLSLAALDAEYVGSDLRSWSSSTAALVRLGLVGADAHRDTRWLERFGGLIANSDRHFGNLSFFARGARVTGLAPAYDMLPMAYRPVQGELVDRPLLPPLPGPADADVARGAWTAAVDLWARVAADDRVSAGFRRIAAENVDAVAAIRSVVDQLPG